MFKKQKLIQAVLLVVALAHFYAFIVDEEFWPISRYAMFSTPHLRGEFPLLGFFAVIPGDPEQEILLNYDKRFSINHFSIFNQISPDIRQAPSREGVHLKLKALLKWYNVINPVKAKALRLYRLQPKYDLRLSDISNLQKERLLNEAAVD